MPIAHTGTYLYVHGVSESMSTGSQRAAVASCRPADVEPATLPAAALESTAPASLHDLRQALDERGRTVAEVTLSVTFEESSALAAQATADRVREYVRAASRLGAGRLTVTVESCADPATARPALAAVEERARREGVTLAVDGVE